MAILLVKDLNKSFGGLRAVSSVNFALGEKEILGIIGPKGAGKTTLINMITGFLKPDAGVIEFNGKDTTGAESDEVAKCGIARTFQLVKPFANITALQNVLTPTCYLYRRVWKALWTRFGISILRCLKRDICPYPG